MQLSVEPGRMCRRAVLTRNTGSGQAETLRNLEAPFVQGDAALPRAADRPPMVRVNALVTDGAQSASR